MKRTLLMTLLAVATLAGSLAGFAKPSIKDKSVNYVTPATAADQITDKVESQVRSAIADGLSNFASSANIALDAQKASYNVVGDALVGAAPVYGIENLTAKDFEAGKTVGAVYLSAPITVANPGTQIPAGLYEIRVLGDPKSPDSKIQFIREGKVFAESAKKIASAAPSQELLPSTRPLPVTGSLKGALAQRPYREGALRPVAYSSSAASTPPTPTMQAFCARICIIFLEFRRFVLPGCPATCGPWVLTGPCLIQ